MFPDAVGRLIMLNENEISKNIRSLGFRRKVVVVGAGAVGATFCYSLAHSGLADDIVLIDKNEDLARGQVLDLAHGQPFFPTISIRVGDSVDYGDAQVVVIAAGAAQKPGETRLDLMKENAGIVAGIAEDVAKQNCSGVMLVVSNPVDIMTYVAIKSSGWDKTRVIGSGTVLDSARFRYLLSDYCGVDVHNVHGYILGEHGDSEFAAWSMTNIAGINVDEYCSVCQGYADWEERRIRIEEEVRNSAYHIISYKGSTHFAVGLALVRIAGAILRGQNSILTISTMIEGEFGLDNVCLSVPCVVTEVGVKRIIESSLSEQELAALSKSASVLVAAAELDILK
jgi:L-lactate dehydrogenase